MIHRRFGSCTTTNNAQIARDKLLSNRYTIGQTDKTQFTRAVHFYWWDNWFDIYIYIYKFTYVYFKDFGDQTHELDFLRK
jgi:hypothetical protein